MPGSTNTAAAAVDLNERLPLDSAIRTGKLDNGLTYYIRQNAEPAKRAELWLAVNAGSVMEEDNQKGLAHFLEHMLFKGTQRFPSQALLDFLQSIGMKFGPDINAYTSFDETVYTLQIPTDKEADFARRFMCCRIGPALRRSRRKISTRSAALSSRNGAYGTRLRPVACRIRSCRCC